MVTNLRIGHTCNPHSSPRPWPQLYITYITQLGHLVPPPTRKFQLLAGLTRAVARVRVRVIIIRAQRRWCEAGAVSSVPPPPPPLITPSPRPMATPDTDTHICQLRTKEACHVRAVQVSPHSAANSVSMCTNNHVTLTRLTANCHANCVPALV